MNEIVDNIHLNKLGRSNLFGTSKLPLR